MRITITPVRAVTNLLRIYDSAEPGIVTAGQQWYPHARAIMQDYARAHGVTPTCAACVTAALSPQVGWDRNLVAAGDVLAGRPLSVGGPLRRNLNIAREIAAIHTRASDALVTMSHYFAHGPKVSAFAANLAGDDVLVTLDSHAIQAAMHDPTITSGLTAAQYAWFAECYARAAHTIGASNCDFQAVVWLAWRATWSPAAKVAHKRARLARNVSH